MPKILLVEDEGVISEPLGIVLRAQKYDVDIATDGCEALSLCQQKTYDLILLDIMMPVCDGIEFLKRAKLSKGAPDTRVVVLSNLALGPELQLALALGAGRCVLKASLTPSGLLALVDEELSAKMV